MVRHLSTKDILNKQFKRSFRGFDIEEVDAFLDQIIRDYDTFQKEISFLQSENERLVNKVDELSKQATVTKGTRSASIPSAGVTNFDILKRLSNLEKHVFGSKLYDWVIPKKLVSDDIVVYNNACWLTFG